MNALIHAVDAFKQLYIACHEIIAVNDECLVISFGMCVL